ncbi:MAG: ATP-binding protein [Bacteriovoracia bacterium]
MRRLLLKSKKSFFLLGPRQTGKSTLVRSLSPELEINLSDEETFVQFLKDPGLLKNTVRNNKTVFIDEIQRIPSLLNTIQFLLDKDKQLRFYITGSSARKLRRGQANLLPGRTFTYELGPLSPSELSDQFDLNLALSKGMLPEIYLEKDDHTWQKLLRSYSITYLKEEIQAEALTRNLEGFSRFFEVAASRSGDFIDFSKYAAQAYIERTSAKRYFEILSDTLVVEPLEAFTKSSKRRLIQHPKYYFFDVGVLNGILNNFQVSPDRIGSLFEHFFLQSILSEFKALDVPVRRSVYRTESGAEVDFIFEIGTTLFAVEVKATKNIGSSDLRGLKSFVEFFGKKCIPIIAYNGDKVLSMENITIYPVLDAIKYIVKNVS